MPLSRVVTALAVATLLSASSIAFSQADPDPLATLRPGHPRLLLHDDELPAIRQTLASDPFAKTIYNDLLASANQLLTQPPDPYTIDGPEVTLLRTARDVEGRIFTLAGLYRITQDRRYADRAIQEMLTVAAYPDWYPKHFLDTAEISAALAVGYDWLYPILTPEQKKTIETALVAKGLDPWILDIAPGRRLAHQTNNWNQVCNGGEILAALALADLEPARARTILAHSRSEIQSIMGLFAPDGGFEEGPVYWNYATIYNVLYLSGLTTALGADFGLSNAPGFSTTGDYRVQSIGPIAQSANFGDAHEETFRSPQMFWLATRFHNPAYAEQEKRLTLQLLDPSRKSIPKESSRFLFFELAWYKPTPHPTELPTSASFSRISQAFVRTSWSDPNAWYFALKGGSARASHGHLDLGSFVFDAEGERWGVDLGPDNYGLPGYFGKQRWSYYRMQTTSHNTLTLDGENESLDAVTPLIPTTSTPGAQSAALDLTSAYPTRLKSWRRTLTLKNESLLVHDELTPSTTVSTTWNFHTRASIQLSPDGRTATLTLGAQHLHAHLTTPSNARFETDTTQPPPPNEPNPGVTHLAIHLPPTSSPQSISVTITP